MRTRLFAALAGTLLLCGGCAQTAAPPPVPTVSVTPVPTESVEPAPTPSTAPGPLIEKTVDRWFGPGWADDSPYGGLGERTYLFQTDGLSVIINYPRVAGEPEDSAINRLLADTALEYWGADDAKRWEDDTLMDGTVDGDWFATREDERLLSVRFRTQWYIMGTAHPGWDAQAVTIDRSTGALLSLADVVNTGDDFETWLYAQDWTALDRWYDGGGEIGNDREYIERQLTLYLGRADPAGHVRDFYLTDSELVIVAWDFQYDTRLSVPLADLDLKGDLWNG